MKKTILFLISVILFSGCSMTKVKPYKPLSATERAENSGAQITIDDISGNTTPQSMIQDIDSNFTELYGKWTSLGATHDTSGELDALYQSADADLTTYAGITPSANVQSLLGAADYSVMRTLLGLVIGTNVQAYDADLTTYAGITPSANVQSLLGAADYSAMLTLLNIVIGTDVQAYDANNASTTTKLDDFGTPDDNTDLNATTSYHGLLPKLGGGTTNYLRADGTWAEPAGGGSGDITSVLGITSGAVPILWQNASQFTGSDATPDVSTAMCWKTNGVVTFTNFDGTPNDNQILIIRCDDAVTFTIGTNIIANNRTTDYIVDTTNGPFYAILMYNGAVSKWDFTNVPSAVLELDAAGYFAGDGAGGVNERTFQDGTYTSATNPDGASGDTTIDLKSIPIVIGVAISDETTDLTASTAKVTFRAPYAFTLTDVIAEVNTAPTGSGIIIDINESGTSVLSTKITIDVSTTDSESAGTQPVISDTTIADRAEIKIDIDQIGSTIAGKGAKVWLYGTRSL